MAEGVNEIGPREISEKGASVKTSEVWFRLQRKTGGFEELDVVRTIDSSGDPVANRENETEDELRGKSTTGH
jgi:hypothetical protein